MSHPFGRRHDHEDIRTLSNPGRRVRLALVQRPGLLRQPPRYRWTLVDYGLLAIPLAAGLLAAAGRFWGWR